MPKRIGLGLEINVNNDAGWCGSGGPWITPDLAMQKVVWSETPLRGPRKFDEVLEQPAKRVGYYEDIAVWRFRRLPIWAAPLWYEILNVTCLREMPYIKL